MVGSFPWSEAVPEHLQAGKAWEVCLFVSEFTQNKKWDVVVFVQQWIFQSAETRGFHSDAVKRDRTEVKSMPMGDLSKNSALLHTQQRVIWDGHGGHRRGGIQNH